MKSTFSNYLRTYRKRSGLTQRELSFLIGCETSQIISRYEHNARAPNLRTVIALQTVFGVSADALFPSIYTDVEAVVHTRVNELAKDLSKLPQTPRRQYKLKILENINNYQPNQTHI